MAQLVKNPPVMWETWVCPGLGRSPGEGSGYPLQYSGLENSMNCTAHGVAESDMAERLSLSFPVAGASQVALVVKNPPAKAGDRSLHD